MTQGELAVLGNFEAVWNRVQQARAGQAHEETGDLRELMDGLWYQRQGYLLLARQATGGCRRRLCRQAKDMDEWLLRLRLGHFLDTCEIYVPQGQCDFASSPLSNLRNLWKNAGGMTEKLQNAAQWRVLLQGGERQGLEQLLGLHKNYLEQSMLELLQ